MYSIILRIVISPLRFVVGRHGHNGWSTAAATMLLPVRNDLASPGRLRLLS